MDTLSADLLQGERAVGRWFNTDLPFEKSASKTPNGYNLRVFPTRIEGVRSPSTSLLNANLQREFKVKERVAFQLRADWLNVGNQSLLNGPNTDPTSTNFGKITSQTNSQNRFLTLQGRLRF